MERKTEELAGSLSMMARPRYRNQRRGYRGGHQARVPRPRVRPLSPGRCVDDAQFWEAWGSVSRSSGNWSKCTVARWSPPAPASARARRLPCVFPSPLCIALRATHRGLIPEPCCHWPKEFPAVDLSGVRILVVDDEADGRELVKRVLVDCGATVFTAGAADEALSLVEREQPQVLVSDIGMPHVDGFELLRRVRALGPAKGGTVPAIALTAFARAEDRTQALHAGFTVHVAKARGAVRARRDRGKCRRPGRRRTKLTCAGPFRESRSFRQSDGRCRTQVHGNVSAPALHCTPVQGESVAAGHIMSLPATPSNRTCPNAPSLSSTTILTLPKVSPGSCSCTANRPSRSATVRGALDALDDDPTVGLVVSDIRMPSVDGFDFHRVLKYRFASLPVVLMTGMPLSDEDNPPRDVRILRKPFPIEDLLQAIGGTLGADAA